MFLTSSASVRTFLTLLALTATVSPSGNAASSPTGRTTFANSLGPIPPAATANLRTLAANDASEQIEFSIAFSMRDFSKMQERIARGEIISRAEIERDHLPLPMDYEPVVNWLRGQGFTITKTERLDRECTTIDQNTSSTLQVHDNANLTAPRYIHLKVARP